MVRTIRLYGRLKNRFGPEFQLDVSTPAEAVRALCVMVPGFEKALVQGHYRFVRGDRKNGLSMPEQALHIGLGKATELHLIPTQAASKKGLGKILGGALLIGAAFATGGLALAPAGFGGAGLFGSSLLVAPGIMGLAAKVGFVMMLNGIAGVISPSPKSSKPDDADKRESFGFSGPGNRSQQGNAVPLIYGRVRAGSLVVSAGIAAEQLGNYGGYNAPGTYGAVDPDLYRDTPWAWGGAFKGGKGGGKQGSVGQEDPNTLQSNATARILDLVSEGPIFGLVDQTNPMKSIYLDDVPVQNSDDSFNFKGITFEERKGNPADDPMKGFSETETETPVGAQCLFNLPLTEAVGDPNVDELRLTVQLPSLISINSEGAIKGSSVQFAFDVQPSGGAYSEVLNATISGKTNTAYQRSYRVPLTGAGPWNVRMRRITPDSVDSKLQNDTYWSGLTEIVSAKMIYPNSALVGVTADARQFGSSIPNRSYDIKGRLLSVPTNYDPETRTYATTGPGTSGGVWDGSFKIAWSDCPAWILYDILTHTRYGLGEDVPASAPNKWVLYEIAQHCDELVPNGTGGFEPRYTINTQITDRGEAWDLIASMCSVFRGMFYWGSGSIEFSYDHDELPSKLVSKANVIDGKFNYSTDHYRSRHSVVIVTWNDPELGYRKNYEVVQDPELLQKYGHKPIEVDAWGATSRGQAHRFGKWILETEKYGELVNYSAGLDHSDVRPGTIVEVNDPEYTDQRWAGRCGLGNSTSQIVLDRPVDFGGNTSGAKVRAVLPDGTVEQRTLDFGAGKTASTGAAASLWVTAPFTSAPAPEAMWSVAASGVTPRLFRVLGVEEAGPMEYGVTAVWHDPNKFPRVEQDLDLPPNTFSNIPTGTLGWPDTVTLADFLFQEGNATMPGALISWSASKDPRVTHYQWQVKLDTETDWSTFHDTTRLSDEIRDIKPGTYSARVRSCNYLGDKSPWRQIDGIALTAGEQALPAISGLVKVRNDAALTTVLRWGAAVDPDGRPVLYEILYHPTSTVLADAAVVGQVGTSEFMVSRVGSYWVRTAFGLHARGAATLSQVASNDLPNTGSAVVPYLTNESHTVATDVAGEGGYYVTAGGSMKVTANGVDVSTGNGVVYSKLSGGTWASINSSTGVYTITDPGADQAEAVFEADYQGLVLQKTYKIAKSKAGVTGASAKVLTLTASAQLYPSDAAGNPTSPSEVITFTANRQGTIETVMWSLTKVDGTAVSNGVTLSGSGDTTRTLTHAQIESAKGATAGVVVTVTVTDGTTISDRVTVVEAQRGATGATGANAVDISISASPSVFRYSKTGALLTGDITLKTTRKNTTNTPTFKIISSDGTVHSVGEADAATHAATFPTAFSSSGPDNLVLLQSWVDFILSDYGGGMLVEARASTAYHSVSITMVQDGRDAILHRGETAPADPVEGDTWYKPSTKQWFQYTSGAWGALLGQIASFDALHADYISVNTITAGKFLTDQGVDLAQAQVPGTASWSTAISSSTDISTPQPVSSEVTSGVIGPSGVVTASGYHHWRSNMSVTVTNSGGGSASSLNSTFNVHMRPYYRIAGGAWVALEGEHNLTLGANLAVGGVATFTTSTGTVDFAAFGNFSDKVFGFSSSLVEFGYTIRIAKGSLNDHVITAIDHSNRFLSIMAK